jgi:NAD+ kinase
MNRRALVVTHGGREEAVAATAEAIRQLEEVGFELVAEVDGVDLTGVEIAVVLGGDGTILRAAEVTRGTDIPLLGFNLGHVGFLAESEREDIREAVRRLAARDYEVEERATLDVRVSVPGAARPLHDWALNEATVEKADRSRMVEVVIEVDGRPLSTFGCDGVVMATATGSTAHAFSAGGPVVWPDVDAMLLVPISAHALFARPLVVGPASVLAIEVLPGTGAAGILSCDGRRRTALPVGARVEVRRSPVPVRLARLSRAPFTDRLVNKFALPVDGWRGRPDGFARGDDGGADARTDAVPSQPAADAVRGG